MCKDHYYEIFINEYFNSLEHIKVSYLWKEFNTNNITENKLLSKIDNIYNKKIL